MDFHFAWITHKDFSEHLMKGTDSILRCETDFLCLCKDTSGESRMSLILINSGELLITLREDWLRLRTESLKFSGLAKIFEGIFPFPVTAALSEVWRTEVLQKRLNILSSSWCLTLAGSWGWLSPGCPGGRCRWRGWPRPGPRRWSWPWGRGWEEAGSEAASPWSGGRHPCNQVMPVTVFTL